MLNNKEKRVFGIIGQPVRQSLSPVIHNFWMRTHKISGTYKKFMVKKGKIGEFLSSKTKENCVLALNITVPHKIDILKYLHHLDISAKIVGSVNTVKLKKNGSLIGFNTDLYGFIQPLKLQIPSWKKYMEKVVVYGSGGSARAVCAGLKTLGAKKIIICGRTMKKSQALKNHIKGKIKVSKWSERNNLLNDATLLVNTTPMGMLGSKPLDLSLEELPTQSVVYDIIYNPIKTNLILEAEKRGNKTIGGIGMLVYQAKSSFHKWFNIWPRSTIYLQNKLERVLKKQC